MFAFNLKDKVFYIRNDKVTCQSVISRCIVENEYKWAGSDNCNKLFGSPGIKYATKHGEISESECFASREELAAHLIGEFERDNEDPSDTEDTSLFYCPDCNEEYILPTESTQCAICAGDDNEFGTLIKVNP